MSVVESSKPMRVVPSGQIYGQMFDAQLQLNRSLSRYDSDSRIQRLKSRELSLPQSLPLIRLEKEDTQHGILTSRQKTWVDGFPNDPYTENPVLYKQYTSFMKQKVLESDSVINGREVSGLPDILVPTKTGSDIVERIAARRQQRHESAVEDMHQELSVISTEMEPLIEQLSAKLLQRLYDDDEVIQKKLKRIETDEELLTYSLDDLHDLWKEVESHSPERQSWILDLDNQLTKIEADRMDKIRDVFTVYGEKLHKISHLMSPDLQRFMDKESQMINQTMLSNRRSYADLFVRLVSADVEREKSQRTTWRRRMQDWKSLITKLAVEDFRTFMKTSEVVTPSGVENVTQILLADQTMLNSRRLEKILELRELLKPPKSTKSAVYRWRQEMKQLSSNLDDVTQIHMRKLHEEYELVCQSCLAQLEKVKEKLLSDGVCTMQRVTHVVDEFMLPLIGEQQRIFEGNLEKMEKLTEAHNVLMEEEIAALFKFSQGAAHLWDVHEIGLARQERALQEKLESCRQTHDQSNQEKEANLDIVMDRMRQDATEIALKDSLIKALTMLDNIRESYEEFHQDQTYIVQSYPDMVGEELTSHDNAILKYFSVTRQLMQLPDMDTEPSDERVESGSKKSKEGSGSAASGGSSQKSSRKTTPHTLQNDDIPLAVAPVILETLTTSRGTEFYVIKDEGKTEVARETKTPEKSAVEEEREEEKFGTFMTEPAVDRDMTEMPDFIRSINIPRGDIVNVKKAIRQNFLEHIDVWSESAIERASSVVIAKCEELNSELDLRLHLHQPRPRRAELDVHNVRAAELVMHSERVTRHCNGMEQSLRDLNQRFKVMNHEHNKLARKFNSDIEALEVIFVNATKSARLIKLQNQVSLELEKFMSVIRASLRQFRQHLDETLQMLRESNARFIKSFKLFCDGGNFCPEEIEEYRKKLEKMSSLIDASEGGIMSDLEGMESKRLDSATKISLEFEDRFKGHMADLVFMERVARWLTNTQVKIKAEVASSNTQAQRLVSLLDQLERRIDACDKPNLDKEQISATQLNDTLAELFQVFVRRSEYLNCHKQPTTTQQSPSTIEETNHLQVPKGTLISPMPLGTPSPMQLNKKVSKDMIHRQVDKAKVGFTGESSPSVKGGKQGVEDPSVGVIKSILNDIHDIKTNVATCYTKLSETQRAQMRFGSDAMLDGDIGGFPPDSNREKTKSAMSQASSKASGEADKSLIKKPSRGSKLAGDIKDIKDLRRISGQTKFDKKYLIFGEKEGEDGEEAEEKHFMALITKTLREALDGLLTTAENFYRVKGARPVTRPQALQETFESCADIILQKMQSYQSQADVYHNQCLQELRGQLTRLEKLGSQVPGLVISQLLKEEIASATAAQADLSEKFQSTLGQLADRQESNKNSLRPTMGHPHAAEDLNNLCAVEAERQADYNTAVEAQTLQLQNCALDQSKAFLDRLVKEAEQQLLQYDAMMVIDDVEKGRVEATRYPTSELIRRKNAGEPLEDDEDKELLPRGKANWIGVPSNQFVLEHRPSKLQVSNTVQTKKTTLAHSATIKARDKAYLDYKEQFEQTLQKIDEEKERLLIAERRWAQSWESSVERIKELYQ